MKRLEQELYQEKLKNLKRAELEAEKLKMAHFKMINSKRINTWQSALDASVVSQLHITSIRIGGSWKHCNANS